MDARRVVRFSVLERCAARVTLTSKVRGALAAIDGPHRIERWAVCELPDGHPPPHYYLGQSSSDLRVRTDWWVTWTESMAPGLVELPDCPFDSDEDFPCLLMKDHPGRHTCFM